MVNYDFLISTDGVLAECCKKAENSAAELKRGDRQKIMNLFTNIHMYRNLLFITKS